MRVRSGLRAAVRPEGQACHRDRSQREPTIPFATHPRARGFTCELTRTVSERRAVTQRTRSREASRREATGAADGPLPDFSSTKIFHALHGTQRNPTSDGLASRGRTGQRVEERSGTMSSKSPNPGPRQASGGPPVAGLRDTQLRAFSAFLCGPSLAEPFAHGCLTITAVQALTPPLPAAPPSPSARGACAGRALSYVLKSLASQLSASHTGEDAQRL